MTANQSIPVNTDSVLFVQQFEQAFAEARRLLIKTATLPPTEAGNISLRIPGEDRLVIASLSDPHSGVAAVVDFELQEHQGSLTDNLKEVAALHIAIYRERPQVNSVIHTHSHYLTAFSIARQPLRAYAMAVLGILKEDEEIPVSAWAPRYTVGPVIDTLRAHPQAPAALLANHGPFAWSSGGVLSATRVLINLEEAAYLTFLAQQIGTPQGFPEGAAEQVRKGWTAS